MNRPSDRVASWRRWRLELSLTAAAIVGILGLIREFLIVSDPNWIVIVGSGSAVTGVPAALALIASKLKEPTAP